MVLFQKRSTDLQKTVPSILTKSLSASKFSKLKIPTEDDIQKFIQCLENSPLSVHDDNDQKSITFNNLMQFPKTIISFLQPATFFLAHSEWPPRSFSDLQVPIGTIIDYITLKASYARNRIAMAKYDTTGNGTLSREETFEICYINTVESFCFFFLDPKHWGKIRITDLLVSGFLETAFGLQNNFEDYENWFVFLTFRIISFKGFPLKKLMK
ncbi:unnamed protein product [Meloidogyne enterolobii]|uniref:Uncharacterized protein n=1 Tax=Meloidogyne enterolobii TaxID=390850 RepID=A0ACB0Y6R2_MELEN